MGKTDPMGNWWDGVMLMRDGGSLLKGESSIPWGPMGM